MKKLNINTHLLDRVTTLEARLREVENYAAILEEQQSVVDTWKEEDPDWEKKAREMIKQIPAADWEKKMKSLARQAPAKLAQIYNLLRDIK